MPSHRPLSQGAPQKWAMTSQKSSQRKNAYLWTTVVTNGANTWLDSCVRHDPRKSRACVTAVGLGRRGRCDGGGRVEQRASVRTHVRLDERSADRESARGAARRRCRRRCRGLDARDAVPDGGHGRDGGKRRQRERGRTGIRGCGCSLHHPRLDSVYRKGRQGVSCFVPTASGGYVEIQVTSWVCIIQCPP